MHLTSFGDLRRRISESYDYDACLLVTSLTEPDPSSYVGRSCSYVSREWESGVGSGKDIFPTPHSLLPTPRSLLRSQPGQSGHPFREFEALHRVVGTEDLAVGSHQPTIERDLDVA